ncbi:hypothetical protein [Petroclostridium xylanilyticum]|jgi:hypothetical protein|uniref:hypothetical protein n=1 Tax=Petroclostridium xylanilyticum TaxID=1792311 RepID=UPI000B98A2F4|nr:hypothetical protein [Petroclostridium xylanilyticum]
MALRGSLASSVASVNPGTVFNIANVTGKGILREICFYLDNQVGVSGQRFEIIIDNVTVFSQDVYNTADFARLLIGKDGTGTSVCAEITLYDSANRDIGGSWRLNLPFQSSMTVRINNTSSSSIIARILVNYVLEV